MARLMRLVNDERYPYPAQTDNTVCPDLVDVAVYGHHRSVVGAHKQRYWGFEREDGRDRFLKEVEQGAFRRGDRNG